MFYPLMINLENKEVLVIGAGSIALNKIENLLNTNASITVVSKEISEEINDLSNKVSIINSEFEFKYITNKTFLVIIATNNSELNESIANYCKDLNILYNNVGNSNNTNVTFMSTIQKEDLTIAISTNGKMPALSKKIKQDILNVIDDSYVENLTLLNEARKLIIKQNEDEQEKKKLINNLLDKSKEELVEVINNLRRCDK